MNEVQHGYYRDTSAGATFEQRLAAIREVLVPGSRIVDLGCNDGRVSLALLESGHASDVVGIDLENIVPAPPPQFHFVAADLRQSGAAVVPDADAILCLNVLHHLLPSGVDLVRGFVADLLQRAETVLVDLGSLTERGPWPWRQLMARLWASDEDVAQELFAAARWRRPLCVYRAQNGRRVLWKLSSRRPASYSFELEQRYRRTISSSPDTKRLVPVESDVEIPPGCTGEVMFYRLKRRESGERFWGKRYFGPRDVTWRREAENAVIEFLRDREPAAILPVDEDADFGAIYPFDEHLLAGAPVHYFDRHLLPRRHQRRFEKLTNLVMTGGPFAGLPVGLIADVQAILTPAGIAFVDFEPSHHYTELVRYLHSATAAQHHDVLAAFYDVNPSPRTDAFPDVKKEIDQALRTDLFCAIARERLRVERNRTIRKGLSDLRSGRVAGTLRSAAVAARTEMLRARRKGPAVRLAIRTLLAPVGRFVRSARR